jgi:hypothetical protein
MPGRTGSSAGGLDEPWIKTIQAFRPEAGDRFVITTKDRLSEAQITRIRDQFADFLPDGCKVAVLTDGLQLELIDAALFPLLMGACFG